MGQRTRNIAPDVEYHRVLAGEQRRIGRGILAIALLVGGMFFLNIVFTVAAAGVDAAIGAEGRGAYTPLVHAAGMASVAVLIPWSMFIQRWLYGVKGASLHSVVSRFRFDVFGRALLLLAPVLIAVTAFQYWVPLPQAAWGYTDVFWFLIATLMLTPLQAAGEEYGFRGLIFRVAGGWTRGAWAGLVVGVVVSGLAFAIVHVTGDMWLNVWYLIFAVGTALITWRTGGVEIAVVLHAGFNTLAFVFDAALHTDLDDVLTDRSVGADVLVLGAAIMGTALVVWLLTRRSGPALTPRPEAAS